MPKFEVDPVCKMDVNPATAKFKKEKNGKTYYFCSRECYNQFK